MPFKVEKSGDKFKVVGPYKEEKKHVYGIHDTEDEAEKQKKALYANTNEADGSVTIIEDGKKSEDVIPAPPGGMDKATPGSAEKYPAIFKPSLFKMPMHKSVHERRIMNFEDFLKRLNYKTHDGQSDDSTQRGHGQNLTGGKNS